MASSGGRRTDGPFLNLDRVGKRRVLVIAAARMIAVVLSILVLYFLIPVDGFNEDRPAAAWIRLAAIWLIFLGVIVLQVRVVVTAKVPQIRAAEAVVESGFIFLCLFALLYASMSAADQAAFSEPLSKIDALYFTTTTFATVGFGDITARSDLARAVVTIQMIAGLGLLAMVAKVVFFAAQRSVDRNL
jgi:voltage-gated potassium channel